MPDKFRMRFEKTGRAIYISHLDLMHTLQRSFSRAGLRIKYSEGFNPHPIFSIALPLSVGTSSVCELMDFRLEGDMDPSGIAPALNAALPEGILIKEVYIPERKAALLKFLELQGRFEYDTAEASAMAEELTSFFSADSLVISKKSKRGFSDFDVISGIRSVSFEAEEGLVRVHAVVSAQEPTFNPDLFCETLRQLAPHLVPDFAAFTRIETYDAEMQVFR